MEEISELIKRVESHCNEIKGISESIESLKSDPCEFKTLKILLAVDGSKNSEEATNYALNLAMQTHGEITLLHVVKKQTDTPLGECLVNERAMFIQGYGIEVDSRVESGDPAENILKVADEVDAGMIVLGINGTGMLKRAIMGSVSEKVLDEAKIPVLVVR